ncbi:MAG: FAD:protein FMN transferase, partial [Planctomycetes bacterium]|nr:FAD:protein FMN transferase [Planctomycetota bacterium]
VAALALWQGTGAPAHVRADLQAPAQFDLQADLQTDLQADLQANLQAEGAALERRIAVMGTACDLEVRAGSRSDALEASEAAVRALAAVEERLSTWRASSELSRLNAAAVGESVELSEALANDLALCRDLTLATDGAFDPSVGPLVALWDLRGSGRVPRDEELESALAQCGFERTFVFDGRLATRRLSGACLEEGAFGKGVGLDAALAALERSAVRGFIDLGGQVATLGIEREVLLADPRDRARPVLAWKLASGSLATSGNSENGRVVDGARIGHILDPRTGRPALDFGSITAHCASAARADAYSTAAFVLGPARALAWDASRDDVALVALCVEGGRLIARAAPELRGALRPLVDDLSIEFCVGEWPSQQVKVQRPKTAR